MLSENDYSGSQARTTSLFSRSQACFRPSPYRLSSRNFHTEPALAVSVNLALNLLMKPPFGVTAFDRVGWFG